MSKYIEMLVGSLNTTFYLFLQFQLGSVVLEQTAAGPTVEAILDHAVTATHCLQNRITELERENLRLIQEQKIALEKLEECACLKEQVPLVSIPDRVLYC